MSGYDSTDPTKDVPDLVRPGAVFLAYRGSESHGTTLPPEDKFGTDEEARRAGVS